MSLSVLPYRALKIGGIEVARERWDEATLVGDEDEEEDALKLDESASKRAKFCLPDWTRTQLPAGAPTVPRAQPKTDHPVQPIGA